MKPIHQFFLITCCIIGFLNCSIPVWAQIEPESITIIRDQWGVPHIYAPTDAAASYGLAWAVAEDDFESVQHNLLAVRGKLAEVLGKEGAILDFVSHLIRVDELVEKEYEHQLSASYRELLEAYAASINRYAEMHPGEVMRKKLFPVNGKDIIKGYTLSLTLMTGVQYNLERIFKGHVKEDHLQQIKGSNGIAVSSQKTKDDKTYLVINSHQPLYGPFAWYEAHLNSDEGLNIHGGTFPGGVCMFIGTNENLGWAHTLNYPDLSDVFKLEMHNREKLKYRFDGKWEDLEKTKYKTRVKLGFIRIPISKKFYWSKYGATVKSKKEFYSIRFPANMDIRAGEQWYEMNKAKNFDDFINVLKMQGLPGMNVVYADKEDNILYMSQGHFPYRDPNYDWLKVLPGDTSATLWIKDYYPLDSLPMIINPDCGYVFNTNNTPSNATCKEYNIPYQSINPSMGFQSGDNNRSVRLSYLLDHFQKVDYDDLKTIKYDSDWHDPIYNYMISNLDQLLNLDPQKYPKIKESIDLLASWDRKTNIENKAASLFALSIYHIMRHLHKNDLLFRYNELEESVFVDVLSKAQKHLKRHFGTVHVPLGELQRHVRGKESYPVAGTPDVLAAMWTVPYKKGRFQSNIGDCFIQFVRFNDNKVEIETVNAYGTSNKKESPHYTDQMEMYVNKQLKPMTLDRKVVEKNAERIYHPH